jgi:hypothetical protein
MMKRYLLLMSAFFMAILAMNAQTIPNTTLSSDFRAEVKSLDEFMARFNGTESKPGIKKDENLRRNNIISLFDFNINKGNSTHEQFTKKINDFIDSVLVNNVRFRISDAGLWAECVCRMKYQGKIKKLNLVLQSEKYKDDLYRWAIVAVKGLKEIGVMDTDRYYAISPAEHEIHFMGLQDYLNANPSQAYGYRCKNSKIDPLSVFLTMVRTSSLKFDVVEKQTFHFFDIPGYVITINELSRQGNNSGWLISSFDKVSSTEKKID